MFFSELLDGVGQLDEHGRDQCDSGGKKEPLSEQQRRERERRCRRVGCVTDAEGAGGHVADDRGHQRGDEGAVLDAPEDDEFQAEEGASDGGSEDRAEAPRDPRGQELAPQGRVDTEAMREPVGEARAHLDSGSFAACASAEEVRQHGPQEHHGRHAQRQLGTLIVDRVDHEVVTALDGLAEALVNPADHKPGERQRVDDRLVA